MDDVGFTDGDKDAVPHHTPEPEIRMAFVAVHRAVDVMPEVLGFPIALALRRYHVDTVFHFSHYITFLIQTYCKTELSTFRNKDNKKTCLLKVL